MLCWVAYSQSILSCVSLTCVLKLFCCSSTSEQAVNVWALGLSVLPGVPPVLALWGTCPSKMKKVGENARLVHLFKTLDFK